MTDSADDSRGEMAADDAVALAEVALVCEHVRRAAGVLLEEAPTLPRTLQQALEDKLNQECIKKFIGDPQTRSLLVERVSAKGERVVAMGRAVWPEERGVLPACMLTFVKTSSEPRKHVPNIWNIFLFL